MCGALAHKGSSLLGSVQQSSSVRGKRHTTRVLYDVLNSVIDFMMMKGVICTRH